MRCEQAAGDIHLLLGPEDMETLLPPHLKPSAILSLSAPLAETPIAERSGPLYGRIPGLEEVVLLGTPGDSYRAAYESNSFRATIGYDWLHQLHMEGTLTLPIEGADRNLRLRWGPFRTTQ